MNDSPCIGICSTTYGDFVCRGCKRYAHEVVGWNRFSDAQRETVWERLGELLMQSIRDHLAFEDRRRQAPGFDAPHEILASLKKEATCDPKQDMRSCLGRLGLATHLRASSITDLPALVLAIENGFLRRSEAHYEYSYSTSLASAVLRRDGEG